MDYSLLVGVHNHPVAVGALHLEIDGLVAQSVDVPRYYIGVIDMLQVDRAPACEPPTAWPVAAMPTAALAPPRLQDWNMNKRIERLAKIVLKVPRSLARCSTPPHILRQS